MQYLCESCCNFSKCRKKLCIDNDCKDYFNFDDMVELLKIEFEKLNENKNKNNEFEVIEFKKHKWTGAVL